MTLENMSEKEFAVFMSEPGILGSSAKVFRDIRVYQNQVRILDEQERINRVKSEFWFLSNLAQLKTLFLVFSYLIALSWGSWLVSVAEFIWVSVWVFLCSEIYTISCPRPWVRRPLRCSRYQEREEALNLSRCIVSRDPESAKYFDFMVEFHPGADKKHFLLVVDTRKQTELYLGIWHQEEKEV